MMQKVDVKLPPSWVKKIDEIVTDEKTHYQKRADVIRKAVCNYLFPDSTG